MKPLADHRVVRFIIPALLVLLVPGLAAASVIDYVTGGQPCHNQATCAKAVDGVTVTLEAKPTGSELFWDDQVRDGIGIYKSGSYEADEIENPEWLTITFSKPVMLTSVGLTDLFWQEVSLWGFRASPAYTECGWYTLNGGPAVDFCQDDPSEVQETAVGWYTIDLGAGVAVTSIGMSGLGVEWFDGGSYSVHQDFSLARLEFTAIPEPATLGLLALALGATAWRLRRR